MPDPESQTNAAFSHTDFADTIEPAGGETETETETETEVNVEVDSAPAAEVAPDVEVEPATPIDADGVLLAAVDLARAELLKITPAETIGEPIGHIVEDKHVLSLLFDCTMTGYPGWHWTVSLSRIDDSSAPSVLETELMPGNDALLAPDWVPWSERLADYRTAQDQAAASALEADGDELDELDELDDEHGDGLDEDELDDDEIEALDELEDEEEYGDDDDGVDALDGIDFDSALSASELHPGESDDAEDDTDERAPEPPAEAVGAQGTVEDK
ncbi:DUF3027 domain-containing protein [Leifsonia sp. A12D58]|uniref:DUF3027 domain-containing protein n=1 Tax=Leifsonia sp. A12D58 TaxID=3397674 RepID=UPI0039E16B50